MAYIYNRDKMSENFRALFQLQYNQWAKFTKQASELWPLSIDDQPEVITDDEMYKRNEEIIRQYRERWGVN